MQPGSIARVLATSETYRLNHQHNWVLQSAGTGSGGGGSSPAGRTILSASLTDDGQLEILYSDGISDKVGRVVGQDGKVYVPQVDENKILSFTVEDDAGAVPDPVDLKSNSQWGDMTNPISKSKYVWEEMNNE